MARGVKNGDIEPLFGGVVNMAANGSSRPRAEVRADHGIARYSLNQWDLWVDV